MPTNNINLNQIRDTDVVLNPAGPGCCLWMQGHTHVLVNLSRSKNMKFLYQELKTQSSLKYRYAMCNFTVDDRMTGKPFSQKTSIKILKVSAHIFQNLVFLNQYARQKFYICSDIVYADGSTRAAAINAATVCLANSGFLMKG